MTKECAQADYFPEETPENRYREPLRLVAIRIRKKRGELFGDGAAVQHCAVRTNLWDWKPQRLLHWHREKAGSMEAAHAVIKSELAGGVADRATEAITVLDLKHSGQAGSSSAAVDPAPDARAEPVRQPVRGAGHIAVAVDRLTIPTDGLSELDFRPPQAEVRPPE